jgi:hypothetical protein
MKIPDIGAISGLIDNFEGKNAAIPRATATIRKYLE